MTTATKIRKGTFRHIEQEIYSYHDTLKEIQLLRDNIMFCKTETDENVGGGRSSEPGRPTEKIATRLTTHKRLTELEKVANAIEKVYTGLPETHRKLVEIKYWKRPQTLTWEGIAEKLHVSRRQAFYMRDEIVWAISEVLGWR